MKFLLLKHVTADLLKISRNRRLKSLDDHMKAAMEWLCMAQDAQKNGGVSIRYSYFRGWMPSYPETTGYIIPTFINYSHHTKDDIYSQRAGKMADWLLSIQKQDGSFNGGPLGSGYDSFVFDTGQIIFGFVEAYKYFKRTEYIEGALKAAEWLMKVQEPNGMWKINAYNSIPHTYYSMVAWALAELGVYSNNAAYIKAACNNIDWALTKQNQYGWFDTTGFTEEMHSAPYTHNIAYTIQGILETGLCLRRNDYIDFITKSANALCDTISRHNYCYGTYDRNWHSDAKYSCLTGDAQIAIILLKLFKIINNQQYLETAIHLNRFLCTTQEVVGKTQVRGAIAGSNPLWGRYERFAYPNWATKFFVDALLLEKMVTTDEK